MRFPEKFDAQIKLQRPDQTAGFAAYITLGRQSMRVVHGERQRWHLLEEGGAYYLSVDCGTSVGYRIGMQLQEHEVREFLAQGKSYAEKSACAAHAAPAAFHKWHLPGFSDRADVSSALEEWEQRNGNAS